MNPSTAVATRPKRKRSAFSYAVDDYYGELEMEVQEQADEDSEIETEGEDDANYGSRKTKGRAKKAKIAKKPKKAMANKEKPFRFLDLPPELRDEIYAYALLDPAGISLVAKTKNFRRTVIRGSFSTESDSYYRGRVRRYTRWPHRRDESQNTTSGDKSNDLIPNLLAVNKQIRKEGSAMLYHQEIVIEDTSALHIFIAQIGSYNRDLLTNITIKGWGEGRGVHKGHNFAALSMLASCTNLQKVFVDCSVGHYRSPQRLARQIFRDGHYFLEALGAARGKYDAALEILEICDWHFDRNGGTGFWPPRGETPDFDPRRREQFDEEIRKMLSRR